MTKKEAIEVIKTTMPYMWKETKEAIQTLIPEFAESDDEKIRKEIIDFLTYGIWNTTTIGNVKQSQKYAKWISYLEKQKEQKPTNSEKPKEWNEEDEKIKHDIENLIHFALREGSAVSPGANTTKEEALDWLKSLRPYHWKPSEEQMKALEEAMDRNDKIGYILRTLRDDIKKI